MGDFDSEVKVTSLAIDLIEAGEKYGFSNIYPRVDDLASELESVGKPVFTAHVTFQPNIGHAPRLWGSDLTIDVVLYTNESDADGVQAKAAISWSSTARTIPMAITAIAQYQKAVELAAYIEALV